MDALQAAQLITRNDANPTMADVMAGTALDFSRADLRTALHNLIRLAIAAGTALDATPAPRPVPAPRPAPRPAAMTGEEWILRTISAA